MDNDNLMKIRFNRETLQKFLENDAEAILEMQEVVVMHLTAEELGIDLFGITNRV